MKKHQEGYVLVYVLVAILVLSALSIGIFSHSLRNLKAQEAAVVYEQDKYTAEGMIEEVVTLLENKPSEITLPATTEDTKIYKDVEIKLISDNDSPMTPQKYFLTTINDTLFVQVTAIIQIDNSNIDNSNEVTYLSYTVSSATLEKGGDVDENVS